jgi:prenylcysteine oxidase/farnesylcysteine lyase
MKVQNILVTTGCLVYAPSALAFRDQVILGDLAATLRVPKSIAIIGKCIGSIL